MRTTLLRLSLAAAVCLLAGCGDTDPAEANTTTPSLAAQPPVATITPDYGTFETTTKTPASVQPSPDGIVTVTAPTLGTIEKISVSVGDRVHPSTPLLTLRSSDISDAQTGRMAARAAAVQTQKVYDMNKQLFGLGAITANDLASSESDLRQAEAVLKGYDQKLSYYGASSGQSLTLKSPIDGIVYEITTHLGEKTSGDPTQALVKIANPKKKNIVATVYEKDLSDYVIGKQVKIVAQGYENIPLTGTITYISDVLDPDSKTVKVYIAPSVDAPYLKVNMFVSVLLASRSVDVYRIPKKSILFKDGKFIVFVKNGTAFTPQTVMIVDDDPAHDSSLVRGLPPHAVIATEAIALDQQ